MLSPWKIAVTNLDIILKSRDIRDIYTLQINVHIVKAIVLPVVMYGCERWSIKKAECQRINVFKLCAGKDSSEYHGLQGDQASQS